MPNKDKKNFFDTDEEKEIGTGAEEVDLDGFSQIEANDEVTEDERQEHDDDIDDIDDIINNIDEIDNASDNYFPSLDSKEYIEDEVTEDEHIEGSHIHIKEIMVTIENDIFNAEKSMHAFAQKKFTTVELNKIKQRLQNIMSDISTLSASLNKDEKIQLSHETKIFNSRVYSIVLLGHTMQALAIKKEKKAGRSNSAKKKKTLLLETKLELQALRIKNLEEVCFGGRIPSSTTASSTTASLSPASEDESNFNFDELVDEDNVYDPSKKENKGWKKFILFGIIIIGFFLGLSYYVNMVSTNKYPDIAIPKIEDKVKDDMVKKATVDTKDSIVPVPSLSDTDAERYNNEYDQQLKDANSEVKTKATKKEDDNISSAPVSTDVMSESESESESESVEQNSSSNKE